MTKAGIRRAEWYVIAAVWLAFTFGGWTISGLVFWWQVNQPSPEVQSPLVLQGCTSVKRLSEIR